MKKLELRIMSYDANVLVDFPAALCFHIYLRWVGISSKVVIGKHVDDIHPTTSTYICIHAYVL